MSTKTTLSISLILVAAALIAAAVLWGRLPDPMPSHWNVAGEIDGYMSKFWGVFLLPIITAVLLPLFMVIPHIDPLKANIAQFRNVYNLFIVFFTAYMVYIYGLTMAAALGYQFNMTYMLLPMVGLLFIGVGYLMKKAKRNFFIGIRTPWTLSDDTVWERTHQLGGTLFYIAGAVTIVCTFLGETGIWFLLAAAMIAALVPIVYSYILYAQIEKSQ